MAFRGSEKSHTAVILLLASVLLVASSASCCSTIFYGRREVLDVQLGHELRRCPSLLHSKLSGRWWCKEMVLINGSAVDAPM